MPRRERKEDHNTGSHKEKMAARRKLQSSRTPGLIPIFTKKRLKELNENLRVAGGNERG